MMYWLILVFVCCVIQNPSKLQKLVFGVSFPAFVLNSQNAGVIRHTVQVACQAFLRWTAERVQKVAAKVSLEKIRIQLPALTFWFQSLMFPGRCSVFVRSYVFLVMCSCQNFSEDSWHYQRSVEYSDIDKYMYVYIKAPNHSVKIFQLTPVIQDSFDKLQSCRPSKLQHHSILSFVPIYKCSICQKRRNLKKKKRGINKMY